MVFVLDFGVSFRNHEARLPHRFSRTLFSFLREEIQTFFGVLYSSFSIFVSRGIKTGVLAEFNGSDLSEKRGEPRRRRPHKKSAGLPRHAIRSRSADRAATDGGTQLARDPAHTCWAPVSRLYRAAKSGRRFLAACGMRRRRKSKEKKRGGKKKEVVVP